MVFIITKLITSVHVKKNVEIESYFCSRFVDMIYGFLIITIITFLAFAIDKQKAIRHKRRIPESTLFALVFLGGTIGGVLAMFIFRHKVSKKSFLWKLFAIVTLQVLIFYLLLKYEFINGI